MRIRSIKPEFWRSPDISSLALEDRLLFIGLWSYVDDNGVGVDRDAVIAADLFADDLSRDPRDTLARVSGGLQRLFEAGRIVRYGVDGRDFFEIVNWKRHQRIDKPAVPRLPSAGAENAVIRETLATVSRDVRDTLAPGTGEQGNRGTEEQGTGEQSFSSEIADAITRPDVQHLLDLLDSEIVANGGKPTGHTKRNQDAMRLLLDRDGRTVEQVEACIRWCQQNEFWRSNILSASKLRDQYDRLRLQAQQQGQQQTARRQGTHLGVIARLQQEEHDAGGGSGAIAPVRELG